MGLKQCGRKPACALPILTGFRALTFHTLLSFQGASSDRSSRLPCGSRSGPVAGAAVTVSWAFQVRQPSDLSPPDIPGAPTVRSRGPGRSGARSAGARTGRHRPNGGSSPGLPGGPAVHPTCFPLRPATMGDGPPRSHVASTVGPIPSSATWGPLAPPRHQHFIQKSRPAPCFLWASGRPPPAVGSRS